MDITIILIILTLLIIKHFIFDFLYQPPFQWKNKGIYGHLGGLIHSGQHILGTFLILILFSINIEKILLILLFEFIIHYHMDWFKMNLNKKYNWACDKNNQFWILTGFDQLVHYLTYMAIIFYLL